MTPLQNYRLKVLEETVQYYSENPKDRRCVNEHSCTYAPETLGKESTSQGCAVGRLLPRDLCIKLDETFPSETIDKIFILRPDILPLNVHALGSEFLKDLQSLHDMERFWDENSLSEFGKNKIFYLKVKYNLNEKS